MKVSEQKPMDKKQEDGFCWTKKLDLFLHTDKGGIVFGKGLPHSLVKTSGKVGSYLPTFYNQLPWIIITNIYFIWTSKALRSVYIRVRIVPKSMLTILTEEAILVWRSMEICRFSHLLIFTTFKYALWTPWLNKILLQRLVLIQEPPQ